MGTDASTRKELLKDLQQLAADLGKSPSQHEMDQAEGYPSSQRYKDRFESWTRAKEAAGLDTKDHGQDEYTRQELLDQLRSLADKLDREPEIADLDAATELPSFQTYVNRFGSWTAAKQAAGIDTDGSHPKKYSHEQLLGSLQQLRADLGREPTSRDLADADDYPSRRTYRDRFGSWMRAKELAGVVDD